LFVVTHAVRRCCHAVGCFAQISRRDENKDAAQPVVTISLLQWMPATEDELEDSDQSDINNARGYEYFISF
jgi:hypothetical protein